MTRLLRTNPTASVLRTTLLLLAAMVASDARAQPQKHFSDKARVSDVLDIGSEISLIELSDGRSYRRATITRHDEDGMSIRHETGLARIRYHDLPPDMQDDVTKIRKRFEAPSPRFSEESMAFFSAISSPYEVNGREVKSGDPRLALVRLSKTSDPLLKSAVDTALALVKNRDEIEHERRGLVDLKIAAILEASKRHKSTDAADLEADPETSSRITDLRSKTADLHRQLRSHVGEIAQRDLPKSDHISSPIRAFLVNPGKLCIANESGSTLHHCLFMTTTRLGAGSSETGFIAFVPELQGRAKVVITYCDLSHVPVAENVDLSLWSDELTCEITSVPGLREIRHQLLRETVAQQKKEQAEAERAASPPTTSHSPLVTGERLNHKPRIPRNPNNPLHQGNGAKIFER